MIWIYKYKNSGKYMGAWKYNSEERDGSHILYKWSFIIKMKRIASWNSVYVGNFEEGKQEGKWLFIF